MDEGQFRDFFGFAAGAAGALIGLLFVALSVASELTAAKRPDTLSDLRPAAALLCFTNVLAVSLLSVIPTVRPGYPAMFSGVGGLLFAAAAARVIAATPGPVGGRLPALRFGYGLAALFGLQFAFALTSLLDESATWPLSSVCGMLTASLLAGIDRSWHLVGQRDTGFASSLRLLLSRPRVGTAGQDEVPPTAGRSGNA